MSEFEKGSPRLSHRDWRRINGEETTTDKVVGIGYLIKAAATGTVQIIRGLPGFIREISQPRTDPHPKE